MSAPIERRYPVALAGIRSAQKPGNGVPAYTRWVNRGLARYVAAAAYTLGISPNGVTAISAVLSAAGLTLLVLVPSTPIIGLWVGLFLAAGYVLDSADGQVARLGKRGSPAGEWLDHVVDAVRTPAIHLAVLVGLSVIPNRPDWALVIAIAYCLVSVGQFFSQILSEQLSGQRAPVDETAGLRQSWLLLPTDTGVLCLIFVTWGYPALFIAVYTAMFALNTIHTAVSMRRKYTRLVALAAVRETREAEVA
ncbi:CDP-alcohol phosphatidyltransferase family protein [Glaciihabitans arcticus]|uniref:CDP-alcohol phosphatidyltransferase family protein n=1 Tax=Glaciihabitans arcticus TaxID=2668039 RepID=A0A4Q9GYV0_9MICO|nr:CDP-alcohol phosphatidyltransferase family protein [Glaciihabitans arcticus]TBN57993.1 CDP-alcohol phosphatidyltransferase family protein [Glaciihabitans arcticus]